MQRREPCRAARYRSGRAQDERVAPAGDLLALELGSERELAAVWSTRAVCAFMLTRWRQVLEPAVDAERLYRMSTQSHGTGDYFRRFMAIAVRVGALHTLGQNQQFVSELAATLAEARATDNWSAQLHLTVNQTVADEIAGQPELALERLRKQRELLPTQRFGILHVLHIAAVLKAALATRAFAWAEATLGELWQRFEHSPVRTVPVFASNRWAYSQLLITRRALGETTRDPTSEVQRQLRELRHVSNAQSFCQRTLARLELLAKRRERAAELLQQSASGFVDAPHEAARDQFARGVLIGGREGEQLCAAALARLSSLGFADPLRFIAACYPELVEASRDGAAA